MVQKVAWIVGVLTGGAAFGMWAEVLGLGGAPDGGGLGMGVAAVLCTLVSAGLFMYLSREWSKQR